MKTENEEAIGLLVLGIIFLGFLFWIMQDNISRDKEYSALSLKRQKIDTYIKTNIIGKKFNIKGDTSIATEFDMMHGLNFTIDAILITLDNHQIIALDSLYQYRINEAK